MSDSPLSLLRIRWLGRVPYAEALEIQRSLFSGSRDDYLLLLEHPHVFTLGARASMENVLVDPDHIGASLVFTDRGGDVTYHGPGQLVGYPIVSAPFRPGVVRDHVQRVEQVLIDALADLGLPGAGRRAGCPGVWIDRAGSAPAKIAAIGVKMSRGRTMHGFALNVSNDLSWFSRIVPCGIADGDVTSLHAEGIHASMADVVDAVAMHAARAWGASRCERQDDTPAATVRKKASAARSVEIQARKPPWLRRTATMGHDFLGLKATMRVLDLATVCEEAGCQNIFECWSDGTATFMINGRQCTRACGFCLVDTRRPDPPDPEEPRRVAEAVTRMGLSHAVVTAVARDDMPDGGAGAFAETIAAIRMRRPGTTIEVLIPDCKGDRQSLGKIFDARPDVLNHNIETVLRLQRQVRPSASYARSLAVLAAAKRAGLATKSGIMVGLGESGDEVIGTLTDLRGVGVDIVTIGQYLRPSSAHLPVHRFWTPGELDALGAAARALGFAHVEASPLTRSSYHARSAAEALETQRDTA